MTNARSVVQIVTAHQQREGAGFIVRRPFPTHGLEQVDPFLMLDEFGPMTYEPGEAVGAPDHPHRGFETVSYLLAGEQLHEDTNGERQFIRPGDVQWMTAGAGIVHSEMPSEAILRDGGTVHGFQIWVNLPAADKMTKPGYQFLPAGDIPTAVGSAGKIEVTVIAGEAFGVSAKIGTHTPIWLQDWRVGADASAAIDVPADFDVAAYCFEGKVALGPESNVIERGQLAKFGPGDSLQVSAADADGGRFLLLAGRPIREPVARYGPFVMNTREELITAVEDYQSGRMGAIAR